MCVFVFVLWMFFLFYDKIEKNKEEFNILISSQSRIINIHVVVFLISDEQTKFLKLL
jgi:hypothetical protein